MEETYIIWLLRRVKILIKDNWSKRRQSHPKNKKNKKKLIRTLIVTLSKEVDKIKKNKKKLFRFCLRFLSKNLMQFGIAT